MSKFIRYLIVGVFTFFLFLVIYLFGAVTDVILNENNSVIIFLIIELFLILAVVCAYPSVRKRISKKFELIDAAFDLSVFISSLIYLFVSFLSVGLFAEMLKGNYSGEHNVVSLIGLGVLVAWGITLVGCIIIVIEILVMEYLIPFINKTK